MFTKAGLLIGAGFLSLSGIVSGQSPLYPKAASSLHAPGICFSEKGSYSFDSLKEGQPVSHTFFFTNTGTEPLLIYHTEISCGGTITGWTKEPVLPGRKGRVDLLYPTEGLGNSYFSGWLRFYANLPESDSCSQSPLTVHGYILADEAKERRNPY